MNARVPVIQLCPAFTFCSVCFLLSTDGSMPVFSQIGDEGVAIAGTL